MTEPGWTDRSGPEALDELGGRTGAALDRLTAATPVDPATTALVRRTVQDVFALPPLPGAAPDGDPSAGDAGAGGDEAVTAFAVQFTTDVSALTDEQRGAFLRAAGGDAFAVTQAIYVADLVPRVRAMLDALFAGPSSWPEVEPARVEAAEHWAAVEDLLLAVHELRALDPVLSEVVRLHGARSHDCRLCRSVRSRPALAAGATEELFDAIDVDGRPGLSPKARTALAVVDAVVWHPGHIGDDLVASVRRELTPEESVELVLDVLRNAANKIAVALGADQANVTDGIEVYEVDDAGIAHYGLEPPLPAPS